MKTIIAATTIWASSLQASEITDRLIQAIAQVETGNDNNKVGKVGERTAWQITAAARWDVLKYRRSRRDSVTYCNKVWSSKQEDVYYVVADYLMVINIECNNHLGRWPTLEETLWCYNMGIRKVKAANFVYARIPHSVVCYADRVIRTMKRN